MKFHLPVLASLVVAAMSLAPSANAAGETVVVKENVMTVYADVLRVTPITQTLKATRSEQVCDEERPEPRTHKWLKTLRNLTKGDEAGISTKDRVTGNGCRIESVEREFRRPIAYDVDYMYQGMKFRSRLPEDPGTRLRIRIGVKPIIK